MKSDPAVFEFTWTDAWVLTSLYCSHKNGGDIDWPALLRMGEALNFNTFKYGELNESLAKLTGNGLIRIRDGHLAYTPLGRQVIAKARFRPGSWFSRVDITLKVLNASETGTAEDQSAARSPIIPAAQYDDAYALFIGQPQQPVDDQIL